ncbi:DUF1513 domain-containing protein [Parasulfitobacter algicola]|uniref:DUF1513 domain-containing protein n=1 Tax=Parasulfitobacter algicola TaxID=2614809 RepID=A0ABX2IZB1_9RHOB|nr:DUF1513 domain-containing protein [Sulfitobacter algicola]NSX55978.1 DUF1513 domain-containing protein [Sulfitobacter algicola]
MARTGRRQFLGGLLAAGLIPKPTWADVGSPVFLSAAATPDGSYVLCGIDAALDVRFQIPLPTRGHAAAAHPSQPEAVAFARRPGTFAIIIDCITGVEKARIDSPMGRHFYGHGTFSSDGSLLFTTENDYEAGRGLIGVWDAQNGFARIDEWDSGGVGPHDIKRLPGTDMLVVANGGIYTHPETGRTKLNIPTMAPNLAYIEDGTVAEIASLPADMHKNSIRHLAVGPEGQVAFGMQWQGDGPVATLVGIHQMGQPVRLMTANANDLRAMQGYVGSIVLSSDGHTIAVTSPRGGFVQEYSVGVGALSKSSAIPDVCGAAVLGQSIFVSAGTGEIGPLNTGGPTLQRQMNVQWDNHLIPISTA